MRAAQREIRDGYTTWRGVRDFISITAWRKRRAKVGFYCAETPDTFTVPRADKV
jgi:hypothetical protein